MIYMSIQKQKTIVQKQNELIEKQNIYRRKPSECRKFISMVTPRLNRQVSIKNVREIKKITTSIQKAITFVPIQQLFALKNIENEEQKGIGMKNPLVNYRKIIVRKQPKLKSYLGMVKFSFSQKTQVEKEGSQVWTRENSPINRLLNVSHVHPNNYQ